MRFLITRPLPDAKRSAVALRAAGHECDIAPLMTIKFLDDIKPDMTHITGFAFTSSNGVRAFARLAPHYALYNALPAFAIGAMTAHTCRDAGLTQIFTSHGTVDALADTIAEHDKGGTILHICGRHIAGDLAALLRARAIAYQREIAYHAEAIAQLAFENAQKLHQKLYDGILFYSPRSVEVFMHAARQRAQERAQEGAQGLFPLPLAFCLSTAVADRARHYGFTAHAAAGNEASLFALIKKFTQTTAN